MTVRVRTLRWYSGSALAEMRWLEGWLEEHSLSEERGLYGWRNGMAGKMAGRVARGAFII
jgi:hypothetical protein